MSTVFRPIVGIDLGTTNSSVAYIRGGKPEIIPSTRGERMIPSVVLIDPQGKVTVGEDARSALVAMPEHTIAAVKRRMGDSALVRLAGREFRPEEISALILKELKTYVDELYGEGEKEAVITVPAYFTDEQRRATKEAGELAGFVVERIINEPTAAALAFGLENLKEDRYLLVYDLGGGTFDVSVVEMMSGIMEVKASAGDRLLGGEDFDWRLVDWMAEQIIQQHGIDPRSDLRGKALLKETAEKVKKELSSEEKVSISLPLVTVKDNQPIGLTTDITREQFVSLIDDLLLRTMDSVRSVLKDAELEIDQIDEILLVGGSTRIPQVQQMMGSFFNRIPRKDVHPDEAVALGAAVQAGLKSGALSDSGLIATDVAPFSMGIAVLGESKRGTVRPGAFSKIIHRNTTIPVTKTERYYTSLPGQTAVSIEIYQGEHDWVKHNSKLGTFLLEGLPENVQEPEGVDVTFRYNLNGILEVTAMSVTTDKEMSIVVQDSLRRESRELFEESVSRLESLWGAQEEEEGWDDLDDLDDIDLDSIELDDIDLVDMDLDDLDELDEEEREASLRQEAARLRQRIDQLADTLNSDERNQLQRLVDDLDSMLSGEVKSIRRLSEIIDELTDLMIGLEVG